MIVRTRPGNRAARAVAEKLGLVRAAELDDQLLTYVDQWAQSTGGDRHADRR